LEDSIFGTFTLTNDIIHLQTEDTSQVILFGLPDGSFDTVVISECEWKINSISEPQCLLNTFNPVFDREFTVEDSLIIRNFISYKHAHLFEEKE